MKTKELMKQLGFECNEYHNRYLDEYRISMFGHNFSLSHRAIDEVAKRTNYNAGVFIDIVSSFMADEIRLKYRYKLSEIYKKNKGVDDEN